MDPAVTLVTANHREIVLAVAIHPQADRAEAADAELSRASITKGTQELSRFLGRLVANVAVILQKAETGRP